MGVHGYTEIIIRKSRQLRQRYIDSNCERQKETLLQRIEEYDFLLESRRKHNQRKIELLEEEQTIIQKFYRA